MAGILRNFQPALNNVFLKIKKTCTHEMDKSFDDCYEVRTVFLDMSKGIYVVS